MNQEKITQIIKLSEEVLAEIRSDKSLQSIERKIDEVIADHNKSTRFFKRL